MMIWRLGWPVQERCLRSSSLNLAQTFGLPSTIQKDLELNALGLRPSGSRQAQFAQLLPRWRLSSHCRGGAVSVGDPSLAYGTARWTGGMPWYQSAGAFPQGRKRQSGLYLQSSDSNHLPISVPV